MANTNVTGDLNSLHWTCSCGAQNEVENLWECLSDHGVVEVGVECDECKAVYELTVPGHSPWTPFGLASLTQRK